MRNNESGNNIILKIIIGVLGVIVLYFGLVAFNVIDGPFSTIDDKKDSITFSIKELEMRKGEVTHLDVINNNGDAFIFTSSDPSVATVDDSTGYIEAKKAGVTTITVQLRKDSNIKDECIVTVVEPVSSIDVESVSLNKQSLSLKVGDSETLHYTLSPNNANIQKVTWSTSNKTVATVSKYGEIKAVGVGNAIIKVVTDNGKEAICNVTVTKKSSSEPPKEENIEVTSISFESNNIKLKIGSNYNLRSRMTIKPSNATNKKITWTSSDSSIATVSNGVVTAIKAGTVTVTAKSSNGKTATCTFVITKSGSTKEVEVTSISFESNNVNMNVGKLYNLKSRMTIKPDNATNKTITWTSSNTSIATVNDGLVTALKAGTVKVTAKADNGEKATCTFVITKSGSTKEVEVTSISFESNNINMNVGKLYNLKSRMTIKPDNATNKTVTWTSSNTSVATVKDGVVTALKAGTATVTAKSNNGKTATCTFVIKAGSTTSDAISSDGTINNKYFNIVTGSGVNKSTALANTKGLNEAISYAKKNGIKNIKLTKGTYVVANIVNKNETILNAAVQLKSNINFNLNGSTLKMYPNSDAQYSVILVYNIKNAKVYNGTLEGDRQKHTCGDGKTLILSEDRRVGPDARKIHKCNDGSKGNGTHEWGMGVRVKDSSSIEIYNLTIKEMTGDGVVVASNKLVFPIVTKNILVHNNEIYNCRRQGITIGRVDGLKVYSNNIHNIKGTDPQAGIDVEPDGTKNYIIKTEIYNNKFSNNGVDFSSYNKLKRCTTKNEVNIIIRDNDFDCKKSHTVYLRESLRKSFTLKDNECQRIRYTGQDYVKCS